MMMVDEERRWLRFEISELKYLLDFEVNKRTELVSLKAFNGVGDSAKWIDKVNSRGGWGRV